MSLLPLGAKIHLALGVTDMRKGLDGLAMLVQGVLRQDPFSGHLFLFRGRKAELLKILWWDGTGLCIFQKRLAKGRFASLWREDGAAARLTASELALFIEGCELIGRRALSPEVVIAKPLVVDRAM